jgi:2-dehydropantoate 2-reductase
VRFIIYGAGGIGGTIGARLFRSGSDVLLIARGPHLEAIQSRGLRFASPTLDETLAIPAVGHPADVDFNDEDVVVLCMKSQHTEGALRDLAAASSDEIPVVCCQNGVANERAALRRFAKVYGMVVFLPAEHLQPGEVVTFAEDRGGVLDAGRYPRGVDATIEQVTGALDAAGFSARADAAIMRQKYAKLLNNLSNAVDAAAGEGSPAIAARLRDEALACYAAAGIDCATAEETRERRSEGIRDSDVPGFHRHGSSSRQSVLRGTGDIEADYLNGEIVQLGRLHGVSTPANWVVQRIGNRMVRQGLSVGAFSLADLEDQIAREAKPAP